MEDSAAFLGRLEEALERRREWIETKRLPLLKDAFRSYQTLMESLVNLLIQKGLLREDPYKYDQGISEVTIPSDESFSENEKLEEVSYRLSAYRHQLDFLNTYYQFSIAFLDMAQLKRTSDLVNYISWKTLTETAKSPTTRAFAQLLGKIRMGKDTMATGIVSDGLTQIDKTLRQIRAGLAELISFHREAFKCELRKKAYPIVPMDGSVAASRAEELRRALRKAFTQACPGQPFYPELLDEALAEDFGPEAEGLRAKLFERLAVKVEKRDEARKKEDDPREMLLESLRILSRTAPEIVTALESIADNNAITSSRRPTLGERIRRWLTRSSDRWEEEQEYEVEYFEPSSATPRTEKIKLGRFVETVRKKASLLASLSNRASTPYQKLEAAEEEQLLQYVSSQLAELNVIHRRMNSLNTYLFSEAPREQRPRLRGIKLELTSIRNGILKANQKKHDYVAKREEAEQMKRMGIS